VNLLLLAAAGVAAGAINSAVGSGTLLTYPLLLAAGLPPVVANGTNSLGISPGNAAGAFVYRKKLTGRRNIVLGLMLMIGLGAAIGASLVLRLPARVFESVVPWLIIGACVLVVVQPRISHYITSRGIDPLDLPKSTIYPLLFLVGIYAGYFGAAQGIVLIAVLGTMYSTDLQISNAAKNVLQGVSNFVAAIVFVIAGAVSWPAAIAVGSGAFLGGFIGAPIAKRMPDAALRTLIVAIGLTAAAVSIWRR
jgi:uncharacterized membrane protein YfcA